MIIYYFFETVPPLMKQQYFFSLATHSCLSPECPQLVLYSISLYIPLIGKDGDDVIDNITCELTGTESMNTQT